MPSPWFTSAIVYEVDIRTFADADGDGYGDLAGFSQRLEHLVDLGVTAVWFNPFFPSPDRDDGYDVAEFYDVQPAMGSLGELRELLGRMHDLGLKVIVELVVNHTSDRHPWFVEALTSKDSRTRGFYVWVDEPPRDTPEQVVFTEDDDRPWTYHEGTGQWYLHRFFEHEPDLDHSDPRVREEVLDIMDFWLELGVDGFRVDAAPYIAQKSAWSGGDEHAYMREMRTNVRRRNEDAVLMAEADVEASHLGDFFGDGDEMNLLLNFLASETIFLALARQSAEPLRRMLGTFPHPPGDATYANFLRNHDELDLEMLSPEDRQLVFDTFAPEPRMRIYGRGIRRRPAPMLGGDGRRLRLAHSLTFTMPGIPIVRYGDEIGMGEDLSLPDRAPVRTPMQWDAGRNAGFSNADPARLHRPVVEEGPFGHRRVNVADQEGDPDSLLAWMRDLIAARSGAPAIGAGAWQILDTDVPQGLGLRFDEGGQVAATFHNLSPETQQVRADLDDVTDLRVVFTDGESSELADGVLKLAPYGYQWVVGRRSPDRPTG